MSDLLDWPAESPQWTREEICFIMEKIPAEIKDLNLNEIETKSDAFPIAFPIDSMRCKTLKDSVSADILENNCNSAYPLIHEQVLRLYIAFILHKRKHGSATERHLYKDMSLLDLIERLLTKRAAMFMGKRDQYILMDNTKGYGKWELIGKDQPEPKLKLHNCLSYDEIKLSVFLSTSSYSHFINEGERKNFGRVSDSRSNIENSGVVIGITGARLVKPGVMEYQESVITKDQNTSENGYGDEKDDSLPAIFAKFYEEPCFIYRELSKEFPGRFIVIDKDNNYFDKVSFAKRISISIDTLLLEANHRAKEKNTTAYIHVVGFGLGVWKAHAVQGNILADTFAQRLKFWGNQLSSVSDVFFSYFDGVSTCGGCKHNEFMKIPNHDLGGIKIYIAKRNPHEKLKGADEGKLLIVSYPGDGNSLPGNEFWKKQLGSTGDSAAAASTQITELHNCFINPKVNANNLHVATFSGILPFTKFQEKFKSNLKRKLE